jgi:NAD(P)-dependent dehydrogenase (short-subunit alcohol dehydrogenase family)
VKSLEERNLPGSVDLVVIDVDSESSVNDAAKTVEKKYGHLDALVNNAAISGEYIDNTSYAPSPKSAGEQLLDALRTNTVGPAITVAAFAQLLGKSTQTPRVINVTSGAGSISVRLDETSPSYQIGYVCLASRSSSRCFCADNSRFHTV